MITKNTVFIIGAGASKDYNYPTGFELKKYICGSDFKMPYSKNGFNQPLFNNDKFEEFKINFKGTGQSMSIDKYLSIKKLLILFLKTHLLLLIVPLLLRGLILKKLGPIWRKKDLMDCRSLNLLHLWSENQL